MSEKSSLPDQPDFIPSNEEKSTTIDLSGTISPVLDNLKNESLSGNSLLNFSKSSLSKFSLSDFYTKQKDQLRPWTAFVNTSKFQTPKNVVPAGTRVLRNVEYFQANYLFVFLGLAIFCLITSPMLIIALAAGLGACYIISLKNRERKISVMGREVSLAQQYVLVAVCCFPLFWIAGAGSAVFWILGASLFFIFSHALFYNSDEMTSTIEQTV